MKVFVLNPDDYHYLLGQLNKKSEATLQQMCQKVDISHLITEQANVNYYKTVENLDAFMIEADFLSCVLERIATNRAELKNER